jgi:hypothetical protein
MRIIPDLTRDQAIRFVLLEAAIDTGVAFEEVLPLAKQWHAWIIEQNTETAPAAPHIPMRGHKGQESPSEPTQSPSPPDDPVAPVEAPVDQARPTEEVHHALDPQTAPVSETRCTAASPGAPTNPSVTPAVPQFAHGTNKERILAFLSERGKRGALSGEISSHTGIKLTVLSVTLNDLKRAKRVALDTHLWYAAEFAPVAEPSPAAPEKVLEPDPKPEVLPNPIPLRERITAFLDKMGRTGAVESGIARSANASASAVSAELSRLLQDRIVTRASAGVTSIWKLRQFCVEPEHRVSVSIPSGIKPDPAPVPIGNRTAICKCSREFRPEYTGQTKCNPCSGKYQAVGEP